MKILELGGLKEKKDNNNIVTVNIGGLGDIDHDLNKFPYPFENESFDEVRIYHTLEHLENPLKVMEEVWRILKHGGIVKIRVPYWKNFSIFENPFHLHEFKESWFINLTPYSGIYVKEETVNMEPFLPKLNFKVVKMKKKRGKYRFWKVYELEVWLKKLDLKEKPIYSKFSLLRYKFL